IEVVVDAADGRELLSQLASRQVDGILLDIRMPVFDGLATLTELHRRNIAIPVAMLTTFGDEDYLSAAVEAGAAGYCLKSDPPASLIQAVVDLAAGGAVFSPRIAPWFLRSAAIERVSAEREARERVSGLSPQLAAVLTELSRGASNADIARR